jgi:regulator of replication initiation timing
MQRLSHCLSNFIDEQKLFNHDIEQRLTDMNNMTNIKQLQQQVLTQDLLVNLTTAYRDIAGLQARIGSLQTENNRLTSSNSCQCRRWSMHVNEHETTLNQSIANKREQTHCEHDTGVHIKNSQIRPQAMFERERYGETYR